MPFGFRDDFGGGVCERPATLLSPAEVGDCLNVLSRGGALQPAPGWEEVGNVPAGQRVLAGAGLPDGRSVVVVWSAASGYQWVVLDGGETSAPAALGAWPAGSAPAEVHLRWTPRGTVAVCAVRGAWPYVIDPPAEAMLLEELDVRTRGGDELRIGVTTEPNLFRDAVSKAETSRFTGEEHAITATVRYVSIGCNSTFQRVTLSFGGAVAGASAALWFVGVDGYVDMTRGPDMESTAIGNAVTLEAPWDPGFAVTSTTAYNGREHATVETGKVRAVVRLDEAFAGAALASVVVQHAQYFRLVCDDISPHLVELHRNRVVFAFGDTIQFGRASRLTGWEPDQEYFAYGGDAITALHTHTAFLAVFLAGGVHAVTGNSFQNRGVQKLVDYSGTKTSRSVASDQGYLCFADAGEQVSLLVGADVQQVTRHCKTMLAAARGTGATAVHVLANDLLLVAYHGGRATTVSYDVDETGDAVRRWRVFLLDPLTVRPDEHGGWQVSVFPIEGPPAAIDMSWSLQDRTPVAVAGGKFYRLSEAAPAVPRRWVLVPAYLGGDPSRHTVQRVTVHVQVDAPCSDAVVVRYYAGGVLGPPLRTDAAVVEAKRGILRWSVPPSLDVVSVFVNCGQRPLVSVTIEYYRRLPGPGRV